MKFKTRIEPMWINQRTNDRPNEQANSALTLLHNEFVVRGYSWRAWYIQYPNCTHIHNL